MNRITLRAAAKLNFSLDILGKREDGYHLMDMVMQTIDLYDEITIEAVLGKNLASLLEYDY